MKTFSWQTLQKFGEEYLVKQGVRLENAQKITDFAVRTEAMGVHTHGMALFSYLDTVLHSEINPKIEPRVEQNFGATALIDGQHGFAQLAFALAQELALEKVKQFGCAIISTKNCAWIAALGTYLVPLAEKGYVAQLWAQMTNCVDAAPVGGYSPRFSTNPVALAFPTPNGPSIFDASTTSIAFRKVLMMVEKGELAPEEIFLDKEGNLSRDPKVVLEGGTILFLGGNYLGHKGYGLSLFNEALAAVAGGSCNNPASKARQNFTLVVLDPAVMSGREYYEQEMGRFIEHLKSSALRPGFDAIRLPGERRIEALAKAPTEGIQVDKSMVALLNKIAEKHQLAKLE